MNNIIEYKGYHSKVEYSAEDNILFGKIEGINDLITFECETAAEVETAFHEAVDDYLAFCEEVGKQPDKEYKGVFQVRVDPELHKRAAIEALKRGETLNAFVAEAVQDKVEGKAKNEIHLHLPETKRDEYILGRTMSWKNTGRLQHARS